MTKILNRPEAFHEEMIEGFADANARYVTAVQGGVVRAARATAGKVAVIVGGGSGHYPSFAGLVGTGLADGAAVGGVFASPSAERIVKVATAAESGGGVLLAFGNYTGDVLNFTIARDRLIANGIDARVVAVTDDIASAPPSAAEQRRGIAGDLIVFKAAGAAAEFGYDLPSVERVARAANRRTRSLGVAFAGCTLPGSRQPLFAIPAGQMSVGMGIHGEPGIEEREAMSADALGRMFVDRLLAERVAGADSRAAVILNGLGATKYEELFVLWRAIARTLRANGVTIVDPEVGELTTSLDMAGCSLTLCWLDDELERLWRAPAESAAFRKDIGARRAPQEMRRPAPVVALVPRASRDANPGGRAVLGIIQALMVALRDNETRLGELDAFAGDGDHGSGMLRGASAAYTAAADAVNAGDGGRAVLRAAADSWSDEGGGTSGALWGAGLRAWADELNETLAPTQREITRGAAAALAAIRTVGGANEGDKTLVDALTPFVRTLAGAGEAGEDLPTAWAMAALAATRAAEATAELVPRAGRARPLAERSVGHPDPGAISFALCVTAVGPLLQCGRSHGQ